MNLDSVKNYIKEIETEVAIIKMVVENCASRNETFVPMVVFYSTDNKEMVVAPVCSETFQSKMTAIAEVMHLHSTMNAHASVVNFVTKVVIDDVEYQMLNMYALSQDNAYVIQIPYLINDKFVEWQNDHASCTSIDHLETDDVAKNVLSMFYHFTHIQNPGFRTEEILSYLSFKGAEIAQINSTFKYVDFSDGN